MGDDSTMEEGPDRATAMWVQGDRDAALACAFREQRRTMHSIAGHLAGTANAADVAQEVLLRVWRQPDAFDPARGSLGRYLTVVARSVSRDLMRNDRSRRRREERDALRSDETQQAPEDGLIRSDVVSSIVGALNSIPQPEREAIVAAFFGQLSYREVAESLHLPEGTVKTRIRSGLRHLRSVLAGQG
jgi:RNA polymerase sigma-70 factor (ECF subfamily)